MRLAQYLVCLLFAFVSAYAQAQTFSIMGNVKSEVRNEKLANVNVGLKHTSHHTLTDENGKYLLEHVKPSKYMLTISSLGHEKLEKEIEVKDKDLSMDLSLKDQVLEYDSIVVVGEKEKTFGVTRLKDVEGTAIYAGKKTEVIVMNDITANTAT
ncbi:MAG TPA: carboxypeptidase-like regulatory domain-containing protein, partial [Cytophagaceae bacterium]|nr:carboxypeptidase-like regulatory domain-containing protein [Cytophagaceae bacterium]